MEITANSKSYLMINNGMVLNYVQFIPDNSQLGVCNQTSKRINPGKVQFEVGLGFDRFAWLLRVMYKEVAYL